MEKEIRILDFALPGQQAPASPEELPGAVLLTALGVRVEQLMKRGRTVQLADGEREQMGPTLTPKEGELLGHFERITDRFPFLAKAVGVPQPLFRRLSRQHVALEQLGFAVDQIDVAIQGGQIICLRGITQDVDALECAARARSDRHPEATYESVVFTPTRTPRDFARIQALARAERTRQQKKQQQDAVSAEAAHAEMLARVRALPVPDIKPNKKTKTP